MRVFSPYFVKLPFFSSIKSRHFCREKVQENKEKSQEAVTSWLVYTGADDGSRTHTEVPITQIYSQICFSCSKNSSNSVVQVASYGHGAFVELFHLLHISVCILRCQMGVDLMDCICVRPSTFPHNGHLVPPQMPCE